MTLLRALARLVSFLLLAALALAGLLTAIFSLQGGTGGLSLPALADNLNLPELRNDVGEFLGRMEDDGPVAWRAALAGLGAVVLGALLLKGAFTPARERLVVLDDDAGGRIAARRRVLGDVAEVLAGQVRGITQTKVRVRPKRRGRGGTLEVAAARTRTSAADEVVRAAEEALRPLSDGSGLSPRVRTRIGERGARVQ